MLEQLRQLSRLTDILVVGGAVRDLFLGREQDSPDIDLLLPTHCFHDALVEMEQVLGRSPFPLSAERGFFRFVLNGATCDISPLSGELAENLAQRDFTVNSMALSLGDYLDRRLDKVHDPYGGKAHLKEKLLSPTHDLALQNDAVRILRAARLMAEYGLTPTAELSLQAAKTSFLLKECAGERIWAELARILNAHSAPLVLDWLDTAGVWDALLPELSREKGVTQNRYHSYCVYEHSRQAFRFYVQVWHSPDFLSAKLRSRVQAELAELDFHMQAVCKLGALLHDIGKPPTQALQEDGRTTFYRHEQVGQEMVSAVSGRLKLPQAEAKALARFVRWHMYLGQLARLPRLHNGHLYRIARRYGEASVPLALFAVADFLGKGEQAQHEQNYGRIVRAAETFLEVWVFKKLEVIRPELPITAPELMCELLLPPGRWIGETMDYLSEQAAMGNLTSREQAVLLAREFCQRR
ncbi:MAG: Multifunctional CCA protein [Firmicutes bacterium]|nr:Multifunctional CCA protein [candidate division NPL-UPA2 bacterium]